MNENLHELLYNMLALFLFVIAIALFFLINKTSYEMMDAFNKESNIDRTLYESRKETEEITVLGSEIICKIHNGLENNIEVKGIEMLKDIEAHTIDFSMIEPLRKYKSTNVISDSGEIIKVIYK